MTYKEFNGLMKKQGLIVKQGCSEITLIAVTGVEIASISTVSKNVVQTAYGTSNRVFRDITNLANTELSCR